jgi:hypothetical protein
MKACPVTGGLHEVQALVLEGVVYESRCIHCGGRWPYFEEVEDAPQAQDPA